MVVDIDPDGDAFVIVTKELEESLPPVTEASAHDSPDEQHDHGEREAASDTTLPEAADGQESQLSIRDSDRSDEKIIYKVSLPVLLRFEYFRTACKPEWSQESSSTKKFEFDGFTPDAVATLLHACHGNWPNLPRDLDIPALLDLAKLMHYTRIYKPFFLIREVWRDWLPSIPTESEPKIEFESGTDVGLADWLCVCYHFGWEQDFKVASGQLLRSLLIEPRFEAAGMEAIERRFITIRRRFWTELMRHIKECKEIYMEGQSCDRDCSDLFFGRAARIEQQFNAKDDEPEYKCSWNDVRAWLRLLGSTCGSFRNRERKSRISCQNNLFESKLEPFLQEQAHEMGGLDMNDFPNAMSDLTHKV